MRSIRAALDKSDPEDPFQAEAAHAAFLPPDEGRVWAEPRHREVHASFRKWGIPHRKLGNFSSDFEEKLLTKHKYMKNRERALNAGCMINHYMPVSFKELVRNNEAFKIES